MLILFFCCLFLSSCCAAAMGSLSNALNGLNLLPSGQQPPQHAQGGPNGMQQGQEPGNWMPNGNPADNMMFFQNGNGGQNGAWADHRSGALL
jgi:hypothetical protein